MTKAPRRPGRQYAAPLLFAHDDLKRQTRDRADPIPENWQPPAYRLFNASELRAAQEKNDLRFRRARVYGADISGMDWRLDDDPKAVERRHPGITAEIAAGRILPRAGEVNAEETGEVVAESN